MRMDSSYSDVMPRLRVIWDLNKIKKQNRKNKSQIRKVGGNRYIQIANHIVKRKS